MLRLDNLFDPVSADQTGITGSIYLGADKGSPAAFDGTDVWPVTYESLQHGNLDQPLARFSQAFVTGATWAASDIRGEVTLELPSLVPAGKPGWKITIGDAIVTMTLTGTVPEISATNGTIAGVIDTEALIESFKLVAGHWDAELCDAATVDNIVQQIRGASDIMKDGTNGDPSKTCDGISIGLGFDGAPVQLGGVVAPESPLPDLCAP